MNSSFIRSATSFSIISFILLLVLIGVNSFSTSSVFWISHKNILFFICNYILSLFVSGALFWSKIKYADFIGYLFLALSTLKIILVILVLKFFIGMEAPLKMNFKISMMLIFVFFLVSDVYHAIQLLKFIDNGKENIGK